MCFGRLPKIDLTTFHEKHNQYSVGKQIPLAIHCGSNEIDGRLLILVTKYVDVSSRKCSKYIGGLTVSTSGSKIVD